ncbi:hypothetical protein [Intestinibacter sp.]|uniref:hypothetical protein n=1 Tax=Intestinibacter sp. TaxID=1965304 RepID=UPI002A74D9A2|nr:hypothetical protein [Intestinibacter sp.]MDY2736062.1 hypothetical protein [Intestinibacter sp.]
MNIPNTVRIGSVDYAVELSEKPIVLDYKQCNGLIDFSQSKIVLDSKTLEQQQLEITFLHEVMHGMLHDRNLEEQDNEQLVEALAYALHQLIRDNPDIFEEQNMVKMAKLYRENKELISYKENGLEG